MPPRRLDSQQECGPAAGRSSSRLPPFVGNQPPGRIPVFSPGVPLGRSSCRHEDSTLSRNLDQPQDDHHRAYLRSWVTNRPEEYQFSPPASRSGGRHAATKTRLSEGIWTSRRTIIIAPTSVRG